MSTPSPDSMSVTRVARPRRPLVRDLPLALGALLLAAIPAAAQAPDAAGGYTDIGSGLNGPALDDGTEGLAALAVGPDGALYAATAGGAVRWGGAAWASHGGPATMHALAVGPDDALYAAGRFTTAAGAADDETLWDGVAQGDGTAWVPLGRGPYSRFTALAISPDGAVFAAGHLTTADGRWTLGVARWDGTAWTPLGADFDGDGYPKNRALYPKIRALAVTPDGAVYAGGEFTMAGGVAVDGVARWDGAGWAPLGRSVSGDGALSVAALAVGPNGALHAGGTYMTAAGVEVGFVAWWDGAAWAPLDGGVRGPVSALVFAPDGALAAGGRFATADGEPAGNVARWDGAAWTPLGGGTEGNVDHLAVGPEGALYAGGYLRTALGRPAANVVRWDGTAWEAVGSGLNGPVSQVAFGPDGALYAGGHFTTVGEVAATRVARWDGAVWAPLGAGVDGEGDLGVSAFAFGRDGAIYTGGNFSEAGDVEVGYVAQWDGAAWHPLGTGVNGDEYPEVRALALAPDGALYVGGDFSEAGGAPAEGVARWDGETWTPLGSGTFTTVSALAVAPDGTLYAAGRRDAEDGTRAFLVARRDSTTWTPLGRDVLAGALVVGPDGAVYAGGRFTTADGVATIGVSCWSGTNWVSLGSGFTSSDRSWVGSLAFGPDGALYAGGEFVTAGGVSAQNAARWDGAAWAPLGGGTDGAVRTLAVDSQGRLVLGGDFTRAGGVTSPYVTLYEPQGRPAD